MTAGTPGATVSGFRLSPRQRSLWLQPRGRGATVQGALLLTGALDEERLRRALGRAARRHGALRTGFRSRPGMTSAVQVVAPAAEPRWRRAETGGGDARRHAAELMRAERGELAPDLAPGLAPLAAVLAPRRVPGLAPDLAPLAAVLAPRRVPGGGEEHLLVLTLPALCADAATLGHLLGELAAGYAADGGDGEEPVQYVQFAEWCHHLATADEESAGREHWQRPEASAPPAALPYQRPAASGAGAGDAQEVPALELSGEGAAELDALAAAWGGAAEDLLLTAWAATAARLGGQESTVVGLACDGRVFPELAGACGPFTRTVPLALSLPAGLGGGEALRRVRRAVEEAEEWQGHLPGGEGLEALPLAFEARPLPAPATAAGVTFRLLADALHGDPSPLRLVVRRQRDGGGLSAAVAADAGTLDAAAAGVAARQVRRVVEELAAAPRAPLARLVRLPEADHRQLFAALAPAPPSTPGAAPRPVVERFAEQVARRPQAPALAAGGVRRTYGELGRAVERVARHLRRLGVGPEDRVVLAIERSPEAVAVLLGTLAAGAAYVPLDPSLPPRRRRMLAAAAHPRAWIAAVQPDEGLVPEGVPVLRLDRERLWEPAAEAAEEPRRHRPAAGERNAAYVLFTSGSTGEPKAVTVERGHLAAYVAGVEQRLELGPGAVYGLVSTLAADLGNTALFPALCGGGCLWLAGAGEAADPRAVAASLATSLEPAREGRLDCLKIVPSHLASLLGGPEGASVLPRRVLVLGGEAAPPRLLERVRELAPGCRVLNHYGPTETTVGVTTHELPASGEAAVATPPLGRPLAASRLYLVDGGLRPVPVGALGEIVVGGATVARGYLGRPAATAERFVPDPFGTAGDRLYRTGDRARWSPEGELRFAGRADGQVKVRGFRVEAGEVRAALLELPGLRDAWVAPVEDAGGTALAAWLVAGAGAVPSAAELRAFLARRLPEAMVPSRFVTVPALPLGPNGKVDAAALPDPVREPAAADTSAPRTLGEEMVAELWRELLGIDGVGTRDDFFALGGHSLLATQLASRLRRTFGVELPLAVLFEEPTVEGVARRVEAAKAAGTAATAVPPLAPQRPPAALDGLPLSFAQERLWLMHQLEGASPAYNIPVALHLRGALSVRALAAALGEVVRRHQVLRTAFVAADGSPRQQVRGWTPLAVPVADLGRLREPDREIEARRLARAEARRLFDLARPPLLRGCLLRHGGRVHDALLTLHHVVSDGWSKGLLVRETGALYAAFRAGAPSPLPELPVQYGDFAAWQRGWLQGETLEREVRYWRQALAGVPEMLELPFLAGTPGTGEGDGGGRVPFALSPELTADLRRLARAEGATLFMVLLAGLHALLHRLTGETRLAVGTDVANRVPAETEGLIGFFVNHLVLPAELGDDPPFRLLLQRVREQTLGAFDHQHLPFDRLVQGLRARRVAGRNPLFQVLLVLQNHPRRELSLADLEISGLSSGLGTSKFDLALFLGERQGALEGSWSHRLGSTAEVEALGRRLEALLTDAVARPDVAVRALRLASGRERAARRRQRMGRLREVQADLTTSRY